MNIIDQAANAALRDPPGAAARRAKVANTPAHRTGARSILDTSVPYHPRFKWPKIAPPLSTEQQALSDDFMKHWHKVLPQRYGAIEKFNHTYPLRHLPDLDRWRTLELGAGIGGHLEFEPLERQQYHCIELRGAMADEIRHRFPSAITVTGDCQKRIPFEDSYFDRIVVIHVLEHLPDLPAAIAEAHRVLKPNGIFSVVLPCDPGLAYELARKISAERIFKARYHVPYRWFIRREHINSPAEILHVLQKHFEIFDKAYFPFLVPFVNLNLCIGVTARKQLVSGI
jgi:SAM-dependent methyltransferase